MIALRQSVFRHRHLAMLTLVLAFALRALIPQGMMTAPDAAHGMTVLLCDGSGAMGRVAVPIGEKPGKAKAAQSCPFAVLAQAVTHDAPRGWIIPAPVEPARPTPQPAGTADPARIDQLQPPARAPPVAA